MADASLRGDGRTVTVRVAISIRKHGGRKLVLAPERTNVTTVPVRRHVDSVMVKALARAFRWNRMLESGEYATVQDLADAEKINPSYVARILRLTLLAPDLVAAIVDGRQAAGLQLEELLTPFPMEWERQLEVLGLGSFSGRDSNFSDYVVSDLPLFRVDDGRRLVTSEARRGVGSRTPRGE